MDPHPTIRHVMLDLAFDGSFLDCISTKEMIDPVQGIGPVEMIAVDLDQIYVVFHGSTLPFTWTTLSRPWDYP